MNNNSGQMTVRTD